MRGHQPAVALRVGADIAEEPDRLIAHGGVCEGGESGEAPGFPLLGLAFWRRAGRLSEEVP